MNSDFRDLLRLCAEHEVRLLIVGGYAAIHYSQPRFTKDIDLWLEPSKENARRLMRVFHAFGIPLIDVTPEDFASEGLQYITAKTPRAPSKAGVVRRKFHLGELGVLAVKKSRDSGGNPTCST